MKAWSPKVLAVYNYQCERALVDYWEASEGLAEFLELIEEDAELYSYFLETYGDYYGKED